MNTRRFYLRRLRYFGTGSRALDWSPQGQRKRFEVLTAVGKLRGRTVMDVGCGLGHFGLFLKNQSIRVKYSGIDMLPEFIDQAVTPGQFFTGDALTEISGGYYDYVVSSGMLNLGSGQNLTQMKRLLVNCFGVCRIGSAVNMLSVHAPKRKRGRHYYDPKTILKFALTLTPRVVLRHDYLSNDFTVYLYRPENP